jgi:hypothetical protein
MEDPEILNKGDFEIDADRNAPIVNSSYNPYAIPHRQE